MNKLEQAIIRAQSNLDRLKQDKAKADQAVMNQPRDGELALKAAALELQVTAAEAGLKRAEEAAKAERDRLSSPEAKAGIKELEKINKEGLKLTADITQALQDLYSDMEKWEALQKQSKTLARQWEKQPFDLGIAGSRLGTVKMAVQRWVQEVHSWERQKEIRSSGGHLAKPVHKKRALPIGEREKMLRERYPVK